MKAICKYNKGKDLSRFEYSKLEDKQFGRFGVSSNTEYGELEVGKEYKVMGIVTFDSYQGYLIDNGSPTVCPCQFFEITDGSIPQNWQFRLVNTDEQIYPFIQSFLGYSELCSDKSAYEKLIVDKDEEALAVYYRRKTELVNTS